MKIYAFIFARGGSKGVPGKNIKDMCGKPLIAYSIEIAKEIKSIEKIFVSTEDDNIATVAKEFGAEIILRPHNLAQDDSPEWLAWQHAVKWLEEKGESFDLFVSLPTTSPLRNKKDITQCLAVLDKETDIVIGITKAIRSPWFNMVQKNDSGFIEVLMKNDNRYSRRQETPEVFDVTTVAYVSRPEYIRKATDIFDGQVKGVEIPAKRALDIDTELDWEFVEFMVASIKKMQMIKPDNKKYLKSLDQLKTDCKIYIFGSGTFARSFLFSLKAYRHDIEILGFINSFKSGELFGHPIIRVNDFRNLPQNYDHVIICADTIHWNAIMGKLMENNISEFFVNLYWDFNLYGQKNNKIRINKKMIHKVRKMFNSNNDVEIFDIITESIKLQHIEKSLIYWQGNKDKKIDYSKYINLNKSDIVINGGAAFSTEAECFSKQVGEQGKVFNFDPNINNAEFKNKKAVSSAINIPMVLWNKTTKVSFRMDGSRSMVVDNNDDHLNVKATSIDDFVSTQNLTKIDFIKLDVEGAEPNVLKGGIESIKLFRPALAVSIYHHLKHYFEIPLYLNEQLTDYQYNIDYYNPYCIDTILYAVPIEKL